MTVFAGCQDREGAAQRIGSLAPGEDISGMGGDPGNILHQGHGIGEDLVIDTLENVAHEFAILRIGGGMGVVNVAAAIGGRLKKL